MKKFEFIRKPKTVKIDIGQNENCQLRLVEALALLCLKTRICKRSFSDIGNRLVPGPLLGRPHNKNFDLSYF